MARIEHRSHLWSDNRSNFVDADKRCLRRIKLTWQRKHLNPLQMTTFQTTVLKRYYHTVLFEKLLLKVYNVHCEGPLNLYNKCICTLGMFRFSRLLYIKKVIIFLDINCLYFFWFRDFRGCYMYIGNCYNTLQYAE